MTNSISIICSNKYKLYSSASNSTKNEAANVSWQLGLSNDVIWRDVDLAWAEFCVQFWALFHGQDHLVLSNFIR